MLTRLGVCLSLSACLLADAAPVSACLIASRDPVVVEGEEALIVWDSARKKEYFIRRADFRGARQSFGFVVPTPTRPALTDVDDTVFNRLAELYTRPPQVLRGRPRGAGAPQGLSNAPAAVLVVERTRVAGLDAVILQATDATALSAWLNQHSFPTPRGMVEWLAPYTRNGWYVTAFRYDPAQAQGAAFSSRAVMMAFDTPRPFFPYSEPSSMRRASGRRFRVSVVSDVRMRGLLGARPWRARVGYAARTQRVHGLLPHAIPAQTVPTEAWVTTFDEAQSRRGADDLYFEPDPRQTEVPPSIDARIR